MQQRELPIRDIIDRDSANGFLFGVVFNQAQRAEKSWEAPYLLAERLKTIDPFQLKDFPLWVLADTISQPPSIHRYAKIMAKYLIGTCHVLAEQYDGDARNIWTPTISCGELVDRFITFPGIGKHKASVAIFLLFVECGVKVIDDGNTPSIKHTCPSLYRRYFPPGEHQLAQNNGD